MKSLKKIVFINQASGYLTVDIVNAFAEDYDEISLISSPIRFQERDLNPKVKVVNTFAHSRKSNFQRIFKWILSTIHIFFLLLFKFRKYEIFYFTLPPLSYWCSLILPNKFSILVFDIYPDVLKTFGVREGNFIYRLWTHINQKLFKKAHKIFTLSNDLSYKIQQYTSRKDIVVINNWSGFTEIIQILKKNNNFVKTHDLKDKFVVQYAGNVSASHNIDVLLDLAKLLEEQEDIIFLIIGRGNHLSYLKERAKKENLINVKYLPFQPDNLLKFSLSSADLSVVVVGDDVADISVPSKIYNLQSLSIPILGISKPNSELSKHLQKYEHGKCFSSKEVDKIVNFIQEFIKDKNMQLKYKKNAARAAEDFSFKNADIYFKEYNK